MNQRHYLIEWTGILARKDMNDPDGESVSAVRGDTSLIDQGSETCIVLVHGAGISKEMWGPQIEGLSQDFRVRVFDLPGHGTHRDSDFDFDAAVESLAEIVTDSRSLPVILVGHSLGGYVALEYASRTPEHISGLILSGSSADYRGWLGLRTRLTAALYRLAAKSQFIDRRFRERTAEQIRGLPIPASTAEAIIEGGFYLHSWGKAGAALVGRDFQTRLEQYDGPVLLLNGEDDSLNVPNAERLATELSNVESEVIADVGHLCNLQAPTVYTQHIRDFSFTHSASGSD